MRRLRNLRKNRTIRDLMSETRLSVSDLIMPYFVIAGRNKKEPLVSLPGIYRLSIDNLIKDLKDTVTQGIKAVLLFGVSREKDKYATAAFSNNGIVQEAIRAIRKNIRDIVIITDVCLCGYTTHGHCGILRDGKLGTDTNYLDSITNNWCLSLISELRTVPTLAKIAVSHAEAGADFVAPSAMMDGQVEAIREALDKEGFFDTGILAYSAKFASNFYGPFREALDSAPQFGDRKTYQMDYRNSDEALREISQDIAEGADIVMVKPALAYLDIIQRAKQNFNLPLAAYNVSAEYAMVKFGAQKGLFNERDMALEVLTAIKRAGADLIITYYAKEAAKWLR